MWKLKLWTHGDFTSHLLGWLWWKRQVLARMCKAATLTHCWWECKMMELLWKTALLFLKMLKHGVTTRLSNSPPKYLPKRSGNTCPHKTCTTMFTTALFIIVKEWKWLKCPPIDEEVNKMWYVHTMDCYMTIKNNKILIDATTQMNLENINAKWKKLVTKDRMLHEKSRIGESTEGK